MTNEEAIKTLKEFNKIKINSYAMQFANISYPDLQEAIETVLIDREKEKEKNKSLEQENSFLKMMYRGTDEFKAIEKLAKEE